MDVEEVYLMWDELHSINYIILILKSPSALEILCRGGRLTFWYHHVFCFWVWLLDCIYSLILVLLID